VNSRLYVDFIERALCERRAKAQHCGYGNETNAAQKVLIYHVGFSLLLSDVFLHPG
jgi:hypothetical protein